MEESKIHLSSFINPDNLPCTDPNFVNYDVEDNTGVSMVFDDALNGGDRSWYWQKYTEFGFFRVRRGFTYMLPWAEYAILLDC